LDSEKNKALKREMNISLVEGMPYQTLVSDILHKYIDGQLVDKSANKTFQRTQKTRR